MKRSSHLPIELPEWLSGDELMYLFEIYPLVHSPAKSLTIYELEESRYRRLGRELGAFQRIATRLSAQKTFGCIWEGRFDSGSEGLFVSVKYGMHGQANLTRRWRATGSPVYLCRLRSHSMGLLGISEWEGRRVRESAALYDPSNTLTVVYCVQFHEDCCGI